MCVCVSVGGAGPPLHPTHLQLAPHAKLHVWPAQKFNEDLLDPETCNLSKQMKRKNKKGLLCRNLLLLRGMVLWPNRYITDVAMRATVSVIAFVNHLVDDLLNSLCPCRESFGDLTSLAKAIAKNQGYTMIHQGNAPQVHLLPFAFDIF